MKRGKDQPAELGAEDPDSWMDRKPLYAAIFSVLPGAGQVYNGENISAAIIFGIWIVTSLLWYFPLMNAMGQLATSTPHTWSMALAQMGGFMRLVFWLAFAISIGTWVYALVDAIVGFNRANERRRQEGTIL